VRIKTNLFDAKQQQLQSAHHCCMYTARTTNYS
jgi:hypothetical protein